MPRMCKLDSLVEFQVKDEGLAEGIHQEAALGQMDGLGRGEDKTPLPRMNLS